MSSTDSADERAADFKQRVANNGPKLKNVPNVRAESGEFFFADYVAKDVHSWAMVPDVDDEEAYVREKAEEMYEAYEWLAEEFPTYVTVERAEDEMFWCEVTVTVPEENGREREKIAEQVGEALLSRQM